MDGENSFATTDEVIGSAIFGLERYPNLHRLLGDKIKGKKFSEKAGSLGIDQLRKGHLDIFYMLATVGGPDNSLKTQYEPILLGIEEAIGALSILKSKEISQSFCRKFLNLDNQETLSAISEIAIGRHFHEGGYRIEFEIPFICNRSDGLPGKKDVDVRVTIGSKFYLIEVYNPFQAIKDPKDCNSGTQNPATCFVSPSQEEIIRKIRFKAENKFGPKGSRKTKPDGRTVLAINLAYSWETIPFQISGLGHDFEKGLCRALEDISALDGFFTYSLPVGETILRMDETKLYVRNEIGGKFIRASFKPDNPIEKSSGIENQWKI